MSTELTKAADGNPLLEGLCQMTEHPIPSLGAKTVNHSIYLPIIP
jgi:hypothetical protein